MKYVISVSFIMIYSAVSAISTFSLDPQVGPFAYGVQSQVLLLGAGQTSSGSAADYSLATIFPFQDALQPLTTYTCVLNNQTVSPNPLRGAQCLYATLGGGNIEFGMDTQPYVVMSDDPLALTCVRQYSTQEAEYVRTSPLQDGNYEIASSIAGIAASGYGQSFALVAPHAGSLGDIGTGIAWCWLNSYTVSGEKPDAPITNYQLTQKGIIPVNSQSQQLVLTGSELVTLDEPILTMATYNWLNAATKRAQQLLIGWHVVGPADPASVVSAVVSVLGVGSTAPALVSMVASPRAVVGDCIICAQGASQEIQISQVAAMQPTGGGLYLVCVGGVGAAGSQLDQVHALPLTSNTYQLASRSASLKDITFQGGSVSVARGYVDVAQNPGDLYGPTAVPAYVGGGPAPGPVEHMWVVGDTVFVSIATPNGADAPGVFMSQAQYQPDDTIGGWTSWQRALISGAPTRGYIYNVNQTMSWQLPLTSPGLSDQLVRYSFNHVTADGMQKLIANYLSGAQSGVQNISNMPVTSPLFNQTLGNRMAATCLTGYQTVIYAMTALDENNLLTPSVGYPQVGVSTSGSTDALTIPAQALVFQGGIFEGAGALITADMAVNGGCDVWLLVGGNGGLYVLADPTTGAGIAPGSISANWQGMPNTLMWQRLGAWKNIQKIYCVGNTVYLITLTGMYQFTLTRQAVSHGIDPTSLITMLDTTSANNSFTGQIINDVIVGDQLALVAMSNGLWQAIGDLTTINSESWIPVSMPEGPGAAQGFWAITASGLATDLVPTNTVEVNNLSVIGMSVSADQARWYRYAVTFNGTMPVVTLLNDVYLLGQPTYFASFGSYRNTIYTDGALWASSRSQTPVSLTYLQRLPINFRVDNRSPIKQGGSDIIWADPLVQAVGQLIRATGSGQWLLPINKGVVTYA